MHRRWALLVAVCVAAVASRAEAASAQPGPGRPAAAVGLARAPVVTPRSGAAPPQAAVRRGGTPLALPLARILASADEASITPERLASLVFPKRDDSAARVSAWTATTTALAPARSIAWRGVTHRELEEGVVKSVVENPRHGVMGSSIVTIELADGRRVRALFKPVSGERDWGLYAKGTLRFREIAASRLNEALGFDLVPPTVERTVRGQKGSLQLYVEDAKPAEEMADLSRMDPALRERMDVFDYLAGNHDRHDGNWLVFDDGVRLHPVGVDHGLAFPSSLFAARLAPPPLALSAGTRARILEADPATVARALVSSGLDEIAVWGVLERLGALKATVGGVRRPTAQQIRTWIVRAGPDS